MATPLLLGIDVGTSSLKAVLVDSAGQLHAREEVPTPPDSPHPAWMEVPPERWWQACCQAVQLALADAEADSVRAVGLSVAFPALVLLDGDGCPVRPAILYADQRSAPQAQHLTDSIGADRFVQLTGNRPVPGNCALPGLLWVAEHEPRDFARTRVLGFANTYLAHKLTGNFALDVASAPLTGLFDVRSGTWSPEILKGSGVSDGLLPPLLQPSESAGPLTAEAARELGLPAGSPVAIGSGDTVTSTLGAAASPEEPFLTCGSTDSLVSIANQPDPVPGFATTGGALAGQWLRIGARSATGSAVAWAARELLATASERISELAAESPVGAHGVLFAPHLAGERTPLWDASARGCFLGLTLASTSGDVARSVLEGVSAGVRTMLDVLEKETGRAVTRVRAAGGGTRDVFWRQLRADVCGTEFLYLGMEETAALGAALLGGVAVGLIADPQNVARQAQERSGPVVVTPDPEAACCYRTMVSRRGRLLLVIR